jgi:AcrR family transcriptional regulator
LAKEAAVTSGALYGHFASKEDAFKETLAAGIDELCAGITALQTGPKWLEAFVDYYLGYKRVCDLGDSCTMQSLTSEVQRADADTKGVFESRINLVAQAVADGLRGRDAEDRMSRAWSLLAILSGGVTLARAVRDPSASNAIASAIRKTALAAAGETRNRTARGGSSRK